MPIPHECDDNGKLKSAPQYICELAAWGRGLEARIAGLEAMPEGWKVHSLRLESTEAERDRYRRTLERLRDAEDCPAIVKAIINESMNL